MAIQKTEGDYGPDLGSSVYIKWTKPESNCSKKNKEHLAPDRNWSQHLRAYELSMMVWPC